jgi:hypothetical protein
MYVNKIFHLQHHKFLLRASGSRGNVHAAMGFAFSRAGENRLNDFSADNSYQRGSFARLDLC